MTTTVRRRRFSAAEQAFIGDQARLMAYLNDRLPPKEWHRTEQLVCETWLEALTTNHEEEVEGQEENGLPVWLAAAARRVIARRSHPAPDVPIGNDIRWSLLTQVLGHSDTWPEHWHQALVRGGQAALLKTAAADMAPAPVVPLPSTMPNRHTSAAAAA